MIKLILFIINSFCYYKICCIKTNDKVVTSVSEGKIIEIYNQGLTQVMSVLKELTNEIKGLNSQVETLSKDNKAL